MLFSLFFCDKSICFLIFLSYLLRIYKTFTIYSLMNKFPLHSLSIVQTQARGNDLLLKVAAIMLIRILAPAPEKIQGG
ncbi:MAG: hypothetical protein D3922_13695 [Candidatus Electrothrix sp. AR1]|nr:hypothetical protein [Candidatus Electrothrix sp. AR1]